MAYAKLSFASETSGPHINPFVRDAPDRSLTVPTASDTYIRILSDEDIESKYKEDTKRESEMDTVHVCAAGCECYADDEVADDVAASDDVYSSPPTATNINSDNSSPTFQSNVKYVGTSVSLPEHGINRGIELTVSPDTIVPGTIQTFRRRYLLKSLRIKAAAARWQLDPNDRERQNIISHEYLSEEQLDILLAPSRAAGAAMQQVEADANLEPLGFEGTSDPDTSTNADDSRVEILEKKVRQAVENFRAMPDDIRPSDTDIEAFVNLIFSYENLFQQDFQNNMEPAKMAPMKVNIRRDVNYSLRPNLRLRNYSDRVTL